MCPTEPKAEKPREWVHICDDNGERNFSVFLHLGEIFLHVMIADLREEHEEIFSC